MKLSTATDVHEKHCKIERRWRDPGGIEIVWIVIVVATALPVLSIKHAVGRRDEPQPRYPRPGPPGPLAREAAWAAMVTLSTHEVRES